MSRFTNAVADVPPEGVTFHRCGAADCDEAVRAFTGEPHDRAGEPHVRHTEHHGDAVTRTVYCSNRCLSASLGGGDDDD